MSEVRTDLVNRTVERTLAMISVETDVVERKFRCMNRSSLLLRHNHHSSIESRADDVERSLRRLWPAPQFDGWADDVKPSILELEWSSYL